MITINFTVPGKPRGKQRPRVTRCGCYTPPETAAYEAAVRMAYHFSKPPCIEHKSMTGVEAVITAYFPVPESWSCSRKERAFGTPYTGKPDADNIAKIILDALNGVASPDDSMVSCMNVAKRYCFSGEKPRVEVTLGIEH